MLRYNATALKSTKIIIVMVVILQPVRATHYIVLFFFFFCTAPLPLRAVGGTHTFKLKTET